MPHSRVSRVGHSPFRDVGHSVVCSFEARNTRSPRSQDAVDLVDGGQQALVVGMGETKRHHEQLLRGLVSDEKERGVFPSRLEKFRVHKRMACNPTHLLRCYADRFVDFDFTTEHIDDIFIVGLMPHRNEAFNPTFGGGRECVRQPCWDVCVRLDKR